MYIGLFDYMISPEPKYQEADMVNPEHTRSFLLIPEIPTYNHIPRPSYLRVQIILKILGYMLKILELQLVHCL
jgi:hypothetical protein